MGPSTFSLQSIKYSGNHLEILDQLLLPHTVEYVVVDTIEDAHHAIKSMKIRGAPAIASLAALAVALHLNRALVADPPPEFLASPEALQTHLTSILDYLYTARPTAVNLGAATRRLKQKLATSLVADQDIRAVVQGLIKEAELVSDEDVGRNKAMAKWGGDWLVDQVKQKRWVTAAEGQCSWRAVDESHVSGL
ncbi:hypothetical protein ONZ45_g17313 [Pleurotus djamor]|nr:hypothetical protein ONZ45_g17313 [Pleurotus djamor]